MVVHVPVSRVITNPFRLKSWMGVVALSKPAMVRPRVLMARLEQSIMFHETELPRAPPLLKMDYIRTTDRFHDGVLVVGLGTAIDALPQLRGLRRRYVIKGCLGRATETFTSEGKTIEERPIGPLTKEMLSNLLGEKFYDTVVLPLPPITQLDERPKIGFREKKRLDKQQEGPALLSYFDLVRKPFTILGIHCTEFELPYFTVEVVTKGDFQPYGLIYSIAHELGTVGHVTRSTVCNIGTFGPNECISNDLIDNPRFVYNALCNGWGLWDTRLISNKHQRGKLEKEKEANERRRLLAMTDGDPRKRVAIDRLVPLMAQGPIAREDCPPEASALRETLLGRKGYKHMEKVVKSMGEEFGVPTSATAKKSALANTTSREDIAEQQSSLIKESSEIDDGSQIHVPLRKRLASGIETNPDRFASYRSQLRGGASSSQEKTGPNARGRKTNLDTNKQVWEVLNKFGGVKERLVEMQKNSRQRAGSIKWKSKYGV